MNKLTNPYRDAELPPTEEMRVSIDVAKSDVITLRQVTLEFGSLTQALTMFVSHLARYVRSNSLTFDSKQQFIDHICDVTGFTDCTDGTGCTTNVPYTKGASGDDGPRISGVGANDQGQKDVSTARSRKQTSKKSQHPVGK